MEFDQLIKHMSTSSRDLFEQAVATASSRTHFAVDIEHWLHECLAQEDPDLNTIFQHFNVSLERLQAGLHLALEGFKTGNNGFPKISPDVGRLLFEAWMLASSQFESLQIRPAHLLLALIENDVLRLRAIRLSEELGKLHGADIRAQCQSLLIGTHAAARTSLAAGSKASALSQFTIDLTAQARAGKIDPVLSRDNQIRQMIDILCRRRQNNPILTGEAGVGKTAVVEGLAQRIAGGEVPESLHNVRLLTLDMGLLQAGAGVKGEFENRLKNVIKEVQQSPQPIILFIDEAHTLIGSGNQASGDAANLLKPALARGELRTIAATTWAEYKKYFESDAALTRRFQVIKVDEPDEQQAIVMLRSLADTLESHHGVTILESAVIAAVQLSHRYISGRQLPDKCVSLLDTACARVALSQQTVPPVLEQCQRRLADIATELRRLEQEQRAGLDQSEAIAGLLSQQTSLTSEHEKLRQRWQQARELIKEIIELRRQIKNDADFTDSATANVPTTASLQEQLKTARAQLDAIQDEQPLLHECVDAQTIAEVVGDWTGIPVGRIQTDEINSVLDLQNILAARVIGQTHALELIGKTMRTARAGLADPRRPLGVFLLVGPSGVGKTETALALAEQLYGSDRSITVINMSEFKEEHKVSLLMGAPPGYVGYGTGGLLTEAVRRKPYSVILLDEMEKAHPGVQDIFYQVFDKGVLRDSEGRDIDFKNTAIIMTSNTASEQIEQLCADPDTRPTHDALISAIGPALRKAYKPAFLGRVNVIPYYPLSEKELSEIATLQLDIIQARIESVYKIKPSFSSGVIKHIISQCQQNDAGARQVHSILNNSLLPQLSEQILSHLSRGVTFNSLKIDIKNDQFQIKVTRQRQTKQKKQKAVVRKQELFAL